MQPKLGTFFYCLPESFDPVLDPTASIVLISSIGKQQHRALFHREGDGGIPRKARVSWLTFLKATSRVVTRCTDMREVCGRYARGVQVAVEPETRIEYTVRRENG